ncbi:ROK family transcriptional regulator [Paenibacillus mendelii]|uniref:ROK family protein n=1 Tax=Paenibacillus mendelii TaxID=206163 RepID=A0ABV6J3U7_9BACL|nr:ROK family transcriptional regulator [Paenibacillus mendelii]MCQ6562019.1 ROK family transcriptional regulator [Paenibacillus mendelii]
MKQVPGNQKLIRSTNQRLILDTVRQSGPISRADLAKTLKLSAPSVSSNVESLIAFGVIREIGMNDVPSLGRPPMLLDFDHDYGAVMAIDMASENIKIVVANLIGTIIGEATLMVPLNPKIKSDMFESLTDKMRQLLENCQISTDKLKAICIGTPGILNKETGYFKIASRFEEWETLNVHDLIEKKFNTKVMVFNDINLVAVGESSLGAGRGYKNLVSINIDIGIGAAIIIDGKLYEGNRLAAGEVGYWIQGIPHAEDMDDLTPYYLDTHISLFALLATIKKELREGQASSIVDYCGNDIDRIDFNAFRMAVANGDPYCLNKTRELVRHLAVVLANIGLLLDLEIIIIGGEATQLGDVLLDPLRGMVNRMTPLNDTTIVYSELGEKSGIYGGLTLALEDAMENILIEAE